MKQKTYFLLCGSVFFVMAAAHLSRLIFGWGIELAGWAAPYWVSAPGLLFPGALAAWSFVLAARCKS